MRHGTYSIVARDPATGELDRLLGLHRAYALATEADELMGQGHAAEAGDRYREAAALAPDADELHPGWRTLLERLSPEFAPAGGAVRAALGWSLERSG